MPRSEPEITPSRPRRPDPLTATATPPRVLVLAYACEPGAGSEPGAGWEWAAAAAEHHQVWLVTGAGHARSVRAALVAESAPPFAAVHFLEEEVGPVPGRSRGRSAHLHYRRWHRLARPFLRELHREWSFDLAHHLTWAVDWQPTAVAGIAGLPFVWGPVGGANRTSLGLARWLGVRGLATDLAREVVTRPARRLWGDPTARRSALTLAQNADVRRRFRAAGPVVVAPNPAIRLPEGIERSCRRGDPQVAVFVGRLLARKGLRLAVAAIAHTDDWSLDIYGEGPDEGSARRLARRLRCADRVRFHGRRPRHEVLDAVARAQALLQPSVTEGSGWAVAEAVTLGTPVVCLDRGGPPVLIRGDEAGIAVPGDARAPAALAEALDRVGDRGPVDWWRAERLPAQIRGHYCRALADAGR